MATIHHQPYHHTTTTTTNATAASSHRLRRHSLDYSSLPSSSSNSLSTLKHYTTLTSTTPYSNITTFSTSTTTPIISTTSTSPFSLDTLERYLAEANLRQADEETRRLLIVLAGEAAIKRGYVFFSEVQFIPKEDLKAIDNLWLKYSNGRFGYSVQKKIWLKVNKDFTKFFMKVGWMKKLDTEIEQFNYRAFPNEFIWELNPTNNDDNNSNSDSNSNDNVPPEGHLPLTNALRGTQLLSMVLTHPAFDEGDDEENRNKENNDVNDEEVVMEEVGKKKSKLASLRDKLFKPNYSF